MSLFKSLATGLIFVSTSWAVFAQEVSDFYNQTKLPKSELGFRAGVNYSFPTITAEIVPASAVVTYLGGIRPKYGYYVGGYFTTDLLPNQLILRVDGTLQMKGVGSEYQGRSVKNAHYYYVGLAPMLGLHLTDKLSVYTGAEVNLLTIRRNAYGQGYPLEVGTTIRFTYAVGPCRLEIGYFKGFTKYDKFHPSGLTNSDNDFYNQNLQAGLLYNWGK